MPAERVRPGNLLGIISIFFSLPFLKVTTFPTCYNNFSLKVKELSPLADVFCICSAPGGPSVAGRLTLPSFLCSAPVAGLGVVPRGLHLCAAAAVAPRSMRALMLEHPATRKKAGFPEQK